MTKAERHRRDEQCLQAYQREQGKEGDALPFGEEPDLIQKLRAAGISFTVDAKWPDFVKEMTENRDAKRVKFIRDVERILKEKRFKG
jgi:hypothetical protein